MSYLTSNRHARVIRLVLRGDSSDSAVLCTASKTFSVSAQQTSNSLLLTPNLRLAADVDDPKEGRLDVVEVFSKVFLQICSSGDITSLADNGIDAYSSTISDTSARVAASARVKVGSVGRR